MLDWNDPDFKNYLIKRVFHNIYAEGTDTRVYILDLSTGHLNFNIICDKAGNERINALYNDR